MIQSDVEKLRLSHGADFAPALDINVVNYNLIKNG